MHRIAAALLITAAVLATNAGMVRDAFADAGVSRMAQSAPATSQPVRSARLLNLLLVLETMRQSQLTLDGHKV